MFESALALDPESVETQSWLAIMLSTQVLDNLSDSDATDIARAEELARRALATSPRSPAAHYAKGQVLRAQGRFEEAISEYETVLAVNRNWVSAYAHLGRCKFFTGSIEEMTPLVAGDPSKSPRWPNRQLVFPDWSRTLGAIAHRRGDSVARESA